jgi:hypothetical protein
MGPAETDIELRLLLDHGVMKGMRFGQRIAECDAVVIGAHVELHEALRFDGAERERDLFVARPVFQAFADRHRVDVFAIAGCGAHENEIGRKV